MHYKSNSFAKEKTRPTISPKITLGSGIELGQRDHLSQIDIKMIQKLYGCASTGMYCLAQLIDKCFNFLFILLHLLFY